MFAGNVDKIESATAGILSDFNKFELLSTRAIMMVMSILTIHDFMPLPIILSIIYTYISIHKEAKMTANRISSNDR